MQISEIPSWFILTALTSYQKTGIELKFCIFQYVEQSEIKTRAFEELEPIVNLSFNQIRTIYYDLKKKQKE